MTAVKTLSFAPAILLIPKEEFLFELLVCLIMPLNNHHR